MRAVEFGVLLAGTVLLTALFYDGLGCDAREIEGKAAWLGLAIQTQKKKKKKRHTCILRDFSACTPVFFASSRVPFAISRFFAIFS